MASPAPGLRLGIQLSTLGAGPPAHLLEIAAAAGFSSVGLSSLETSAWLDEGLTIPGLRRELHARDLSASYLDPLMIWVGGVAPALPSLSPDRVIELAVELEVPRINITIAGRFDEHEAIETFAEVSERITSAGLIPMLEFAPFFAVSSLARAEIVIEGAETPDAGLLLDTWHFARSAGSLGDLSRLPSGRVHVMHLSDVVPVASRDLLHETMHARIYPGDGAGEIASVIREVVAHSPECDFTVEVYSPTLLGDDANAFARRCHASASSVIRKATSY